MDEDEELSVKEEELNEELERSQADSLKLYPKHIKNSPSVYELSREQIHICPVEKYYRLYMYRVEAYLDTQTGNIYKYSTVKLKNGRCQKDKVGVTNLLGLLHLKRNALVTFFAWLFYLPV